jgi:hypothetical protein
VSGNPAGRPKGARNKLEEAFLVDLHNSWQTSGASVIATVIEKDPATYLRVVAGLIPRKVLETEDESVNRDQVRRAIAVIESWIVASNAEGSGPAAIDSGTAERLQAVSETD